MLLSLLGKKQKTTMTLIGMHKAGLGWCSCLGPGRHQQNTEGTRPGLQGAQRGSGGPCSLPEGVRSFLQGLLTHIPESTLPCCVPAGRAPARASALPSGKWDGRHDVIYSSRVGRGCWLLRESSGLMGRWVTPGQVWESSSQETCI